MLKRKKKQKKLLEDHKVKCLEIDVLNELTQKYSLSYMYMAQPRSDSNFHLRLVICLYYALQ